MELVCAGKRADMETLLVKHTWHDVHNQSAECRYVALMDADLQLLACLSTNMLFTYTDNVTTVDGRPRLTSQDHLPVRFIHIRAAVGGPLNTTRPSAAAGSARGRPPPT